MDYKYKKYKKKYLQLKKKQTGGGNNIKVFYHIYCNEYTEKIVQDQLTKIIFSNLYELANAIYCFLTGEEQYINVCKELINHYGKKFIIQDIGINDKSYERFTLYRIKPLINDNDKILYIHSKGVTKPDNKIVYLWRTHMEYFLIKKCDECIKYLDNYDVVGVEYSPTKQFSGNFWWSTGKYYLSLPDSIGNEYVGPEKYLFLNNPKYIELNASGNIFNIYGKAYYPFNYIDQ